MGKSRPSQRRVPDSPPRIIGGAFRGRKLFFSGAAHVRPMKDRVREVVFNLLGPSVKEKHALDLFAGTGALGFEALSRGASSATFIERHLATASDLRRTAAELNVEERVKILTGDTFFCLRNPPEVGSKAWVVFCSPPYDFFVDRCDDMIDLLARLIDWAPPESLFAVETDQRFDFARLPQASNWDVRSNRPAQIGILRIDKMPDRAQAD